MEQKIKVYKKLLKERGYNQLSDESDVDDENNDKINKETLLKEKEEEKQTKKNMKIMENLHLINIMMNIIELIK